MFQKLIRKTLVLLFVILAVAGFGKLTQAQVCQPTTNNLVSWYRGEGNAQDAQAVNNGTLQNGTSFAPGKIGQGFKFDGADDFVEIPDAASLRPQQLTLEAWVKFDDLSSTVTGNAPPGFQYIVFKKNANQLLFEGYSLIKLPGNRLAYSNSSNGGVQTTIVDNTQTVEVGKFYHVVGTYDGATARLYVNGRKVAEASHNLPLDLGTRPLVIGGTNETNWDGKMNGVIDDVKIYNRALNDTEIFSNYRTGSSLIVNCDAEADQTAAGSGSTNHDVSGWNNENGEFTVVRYASTGGSYPTTTDPGPDGRGAFFFSGGQTATSSASQIINVSAYAAPIDFRIQKYNLSGYLGGFANQADNARVTATFRDAANNPIGSAVIGPVTPADRNGVTSLLSRSASGILPIGTRSVKIALLFTRFEGTFNDGYADNLSFTLNQAAEISTNLAAWHGGDGDARDFLGFSNGNLINTPRFVVGKVGQALRFQNGSHVQINSNGIFRGRTEGTIEAWIKPSALPNGEFNASGIWVESESTRNFTRLGLYYLTSGQVGVYANNSQVFATSPTAVPLNAWTHVAGTYKAGETAKLYVNGVLVSESAGIGSVLSDDPGAFIGIGALLSAQGDDFDFNGDIDEPAVYQRALAKNEIEAIYNAGTAGKSRQISTITGNNVSVFPRDANITFSAVTTAGETSQTPLETADLPALPSGFAQTGLAYDISTTAVYSGNISICFNLPALTGASFGRLRILHRENGNWVDRTTSNNSPQLCGQVTSLSPFVIAENLNVTASEVTIGGQVLSGKRGLGNVRIFLTNGSGETRTALTNPFGYYRFANVPAGATYVLSADSKRYVFAQPTQVLFVTEDTMNVDFSAY